MRRLYAVIAVLFALSLFTPTAMSQGASPGPGAAACVSPEIPPGTPTPMEAVASPEGAMEASPEGEADSGQAASSEIPVGEPAPDDVVAAVEAAVQNGINCINAGDYVAFAALFTPDALMDECGTTNVYDGPMCFSGGSPITHSEISDIQMHADGRVSADLILQFGSFVTHERQFFVAADDGTYLLDLSPDLPVAIPEGATIIDGELVDYAFELSQTSAPTGDIAFNVTNTGEYPHEIVMLQLPDGVTVDALFEDESLFEQVQFIGFTVAAPGQAADPLVLMDMQPGTYTLVCFVDVPEGVPHVMRGMVLEFEVTP